MNLIQYSTIAKFQEDQLLSPASFYNDLTNEAISQDYQHAQKIWSLFKMHTLGDYFDLYVKTDVILLAEMFESFLGLCKQSNDIDAAHLVTSPGLSQQVCLKMTGVELELLTDVNMLLFVEQDIRDGVSQVSHRFATADNAQVPNHKPDEDTLYILFWNDNKL